MPPPPAAAGQDGIDRRAWPAGLVVDRWDAPDSWPLRRFALPPRPGTAVRGRLLFLGGRGDFFEKYLEAIACWSAQGWAVTGFDWRGQGGSGAGHPDGLCHLTDMAPLVADCAAFVRAWRGDPSAARLAGDPPIGPVAGPHVAVAHSMGGHIVLRMLAEGHAALDAVVLAAPMLGVRFGPFGDRTIHRIARVGDVGTMRDRPIWSAARAPRPGRMTSCPDRHADKLWWKARCPDLARGGPSWAWLAAAARSMATLDRALATGPRLPPVLTLVGTADPVIDRRAVRRTARRLPGGGHIDIAGAGHELLRERDALRHAALDRMTGFFDRFAG